MLVYKSFLLIKLLQFKSVGPDPAIIKATGGLELFKYSYLGTTNLL